MVVPPRPELIINVARALELDQLRREVRPEREKHRIHSHSSRACLLAPLARDVRATHIAHCTLHVDGQAVIAIKEGMRALCRFDRVLSFLLRASILTL